MTAQIRPRHELPEVVVLNTAAMSSGLELALLLYSTITQTTFQLLHCVESGGGDERVLFLAANVTCYTPWQKALFGMDSEAAASAEVRRRPGAAHRHFSVCPAVYNYLLTGVSLGDPRVLEGGLGRHPRAFPPRTALVLASSRRCFDVGIGGSHSSSFGDLY